MAAIRELSPEVAVRTYLTYLQDPDSLVDGAAVQKLQAQVDAARDPIDRLKAVAALHRAKNVDPNAHKYEFIKYAKSWAESEGIPPNAFSQLNVPSDVLAAAGLLPKGKRGRRPAKMTAE